jgi:uncharacterized protein
MIKLLEKLLIVQDRDVRLMRLKMELDRIPHEKAEIDREEKNAIDAAEQAKADSRRIEADRKKIEVSVGGKQDQVRKYKTQLLEIKNNDQFHALQHEITAAEGEIRQMEDQELELMEKMEGVQLAVKQSDAKLKETQQRLQTRRKDIEAKSQQLEKQLQEVEQDREKLAVEIEDDVLSRYERIFKSKHGQAIVGIAHGMCKGCNIKITAQEIHKAQGGNELVSCTNCDRILYSE